MSRSNAKKIAEELGLTFDGMQGEFYQFSTKEMITFYVEDLTQVKARLKERLIEFGIVACADKAASTLYSTDDSLGL